MPSENETAQDGVQPVERAEQHAQERDCPDCGSGDLAAEEFSIEGEGDAPTLNGAETVCQDCGRVVVG